MKASVIIDAGPLVALVNARDGNHKWTVAQLERVASPMVTCESAVSEALFLLRAVHGGVAAIAGMLSSGGLRVDFSLTAEMATICALMIKYADVPMSLADACLVRMSEQFPKHRVMTFDSDFRQYRRNRRQSIPLLAPPHI